MIRHDPSGDTVATTNPSTLRANPHLEWPNWVANIQRGLPGECLASLVDGPLRILQQASTVARWCGLALTIIAAGVLVIWWVWWGGEGDALAQARRAGVIRIGYAVEAPFAFLTTDGRVTGEAPEIARVIATRLGVPRVAWTLEEFGDLIDALEARQFDVIAAGMFFTPERERRVAFSVPTFRTGPGLLVRKGNPLGLHSYADLFRRHEVRVAVLIGSAEEAGLRQHGYPAERLVPVPDASSGRATVRSGQADALALSAPTLRWMMRHPIAGQTEMAEWSADPGDEPVPSMATGGFVFRQGDASLRRAWNAELARFIGSEEHRRLVSAFGFTAAEIPPSSDASRPTPLP